MSESETPPTPAPDHPLKPRSTTNLFLGLHLAAGVLFLAVLNLFSLAASRDWALDLLTHFRFQYAVVFLVAGVCLLLLRWRRMAVVAAAGLVFNAWFVVPLVLPNADTRAAEALQADREVTGLSVLHFNVHTSNPNKQQVAARVRDSGADIVFLQEIDQGWVEAMAAQLGGYEPVKLDPRSDNFGIGCWVRDGSGVEVVSIDAVDISGGRAQVNALDVVARLPEGETVRLVSLHTLPPVSRPYAEARDAQLAAVAEIAREADGPFILIGDLNATPWSSSYRALVRDGGLTDSLRGRGFNGLSAPGASWPAGMLSLGMIPIDHCLTRGGAVVVERRLGEANGSDHRPLFVEIRLVD